jgi:hypothetical protein
MVGPLSFSQSDSYFDLKKRLIQRMQSAKIDDEILNTVAKIFEKILASENVVLSRPEKARLLRQILKPVLTDMVAKLDGDK